MKSKLNFASKRLSKLAEKEKKRILSVALHLRSVCVQTATCGCPSLNPGKCNHVTAMLFNIPDYSLKFKTCSCTSNWRKWEVPNIKKNLVYMQKIKKFRTGVWLFLKKNNNTWCKLLHTPVSTYLREKCITNWGAFLTS